MESSSLSTINTNFTTACGPSKQQVVSASKNKWMCPRCTYLNSIKSFRCTQCSTKREQDLNNVNDHIKALNIKDTESDLIETHTSNRASPISTSSDTVSNPKTNLGAISRISSNEPKTYYVNKWFCTVKQNLRF